MAVAQKAGQPDLFDRVTAFAGEQPIPSFLHSALCAMSLPVRRPANELAPVLRMDGQYKLAITPRPILQADGTLLTLGVPYGALPRLILIHIMSQAVRTQSREVHLGETLTDWMRQMGYRTISYGPRGSATLIRQQLDRLLACEWIIRWDGQAADGASEFGIKEIKLSDEYTGFNRKTGKFGREIRLTEAFFSHLREHAVPLDENAIRQLRDSPTALDLYTWLAYRLPRIGTRRAATLSWQQLASHFGNEGHNIRKFRQTVRDAWDRQVSAVYPDARADFGGGLIRLEHSPPPLRRTVVKVANLRLVTNTAAPALDAPPTDAGSTPAHFLRLLRATLPPVEARSWLGDAALSRVDDEWVLTLPSKYRASWVRSNLEVQIARATLAAGLSAAPRVIARPA